MSSSLFLGPAGSSRSPLWIVTQEPQLDALVTYLDSMRRSMAEKGAATQYLHFSRSRLDEARDAFGRMILRGERKLHQLCQLLSDTWFGGEYRLQSVVVGEAGNERFTLVQDLSTSDLYGQTDLDLGNRQLERIRLQHQGTWRRAALVANFVEYEALEARSASVLKLVSRIKAEEEIWNKVVDELFTLDRRVRRDKELRHLSRFVKDIFGIKLVVEGVEEAFEVQRRLGELRFEEDRLRALGLDDVDSAGRLEVLETKDYLRQGAKSSGWQALKSVVRWGGTTVEIQIQPLRSFHRERERFTRESHAEFKSRREILRNEIARMDPLFAFYRDLLRWLFLDPDGAPPSYGSVRIEVSDDSPGPSSSEELARRR